MKTVEAYGVRGRALKLACTYLRKCESMLHMDLPLDPGYWDLLEQALDTAYEIVCKLPDDFFETTKADNVLGLLGGSQFNLNMSDTANEHIEKLARLMVERRLKSARDRKIALLENVEGRTPEEAKLYLERASRMRGDT